MIQTSVSSQKRKRSNRSSSSNADQSEGFISPESSQKSGSTSNADLDGSEIDDAMEKIGSAMRQLKPPHPCKNAKKKARANTKISFNTLPTDTDPKWQDLQEAKTIPSKGGKPPDKFVRKISVPCCPTGEPPPNQNQHYRCIASSVCDWRIKNVHRPLARIYKHAIRCRSLEKWKPELFKMAQQEFARTSAPSGALPSETPGPSNPPSSTLFPAASTSSSALSRSTPEVRTSKVETSNPFASFF